MKNLLYKELKLAIHPLIYVFILGTPLFILVPEMNACVLFLYPVACFSILFLGVNKGQQTNDLLYTVLLPIRKRDAVKARLFSCALIQVVFIGLCFALLPIAINNYNTYSDPNSGIQLAAYTARHFVAAAGFGIIGYAIVDIIYFAFFYRNGKSILASTLIATLAFVVYIFLTTVILPTVPVLEPFFMDLLAGTWLNQIIFFIIALAISVGLNFVAYKIGAKEIEKVDF